MDNFFFGNNKYSKTDSKQEFGEVSSNYTRTYSKGKSFKFSVWNKSDTYNNDDFVQDFVKHEQNLWAAKKTSTNIVPSENNDCWDLVLEGVSNIEFRQHGDKIQWKWEDSNEWKDLIQFGTVSTEDINNMLSELEIEFRNVYDTELSNTSVNAVQNKVITKAFDYFKEYVTSEISKSSSEIESVKQNIQKLSEAINNILNKYQVKLIPGEGIVIKDNVISTTTLFNIVDNLPTEGKRNIIYLVLSSEHKTNIFKEYIWINNKWESLGEFKADINLSEYAKKEEFATINGQSILNGGNIVIEGSESNSWKTLSVPEKTVYMTIDENDVGSYNIPRIGDTSWIESRSCLVKPTNDGVAICYLDNDDRSKFHDGTEAVLDGSMGELMVDFPELYMTYTDCGNNVAGIKLSKESGQHTFKRTLVGAVPGSLDTNGYLQSVHLEWENEYAEWNVGIDRGNGWSQLDYEFWKELMLMCWAKHGTTNLGSVYNLYGNWDVIKNENNTQIFGLDVLSHYHIRLYGIYLFDNDDSSTIYFFEGSPEQENLDDKIHNRINNNVVRDSGRFLTIMWPELLPKTISKSSSKYQMNYSSDPRGFGWISSLTDFKFADYLGACALTRVIYRGNITVIDDPEEFKLI